jgi:hypothetical protein
MTTSVDAASEAAPFCREPEMRIETHCGQNFVVGPISAMAAVIFIQPMIYMKNQLQSAEHKRFEKNPRILYRGVGGFAMSFAPTIAVQTVANGLFANFFNSLLSAAAAGIVSAIVVCPAEGIMIQQQKSGQGFLKTVKAIKAKSIFFFFKGIGSTGVREGLFSAAYLGATPMLKEKIQFYGIPEWGAQMLAGIISGSLAATFSHPFDTVKTRMQRDFSQTFSIKAIFKKSAFAGLGWSIPMVSTATIIIPYVQEKLNSQIERFKK